MLDGGARFPEVITIRLPAGFLDRIRTAAEGEGIAPRDFTRRAICERLLRLEATKLEQAHATAGSSPPNPDTLSACAAGTPTSGASASVTPSTRKDA